MLVYSARLTKLPVLSLQTGSPLAYTAEPIIDPRRLHITAFYCEGPLLDFQPAVVHTDDIREFSELGLIVNDSEDVMPPDDLVRLQEVINFNFTFIGMKVVDDRNTKLGKVEDYVTETDSFLIQTFVVKRPLLKSFNEAKLVISRNQIAEIKDDVIVVKSPTIQEPAKTAPVHKPEFDNPFRKTKPQIEGFRVDSR